MQVINVLMQGKIGVELRKNNNMVEMLVSDTGVGIMPENVSKVFSRFSNFKTAYNRTNEGTVRHHFITHHLHY